MTLPDPLPTADAPTLTEFLLARIAEDEAGANVVADELSLMGGNAGPDWEAREGRLYVGPTISIFQTRDSLVGHIARHDPARVLAECEAKRLIVERCAEQAGEGPGVDYLRERVLELLALPYADHPDYRSEWRP